MPGVPSDIHRCTDPRHCLSAGNRAERPESGVTVWRYPRGMFERLRRALTGSAPEPPPAATPAEPGRLDWITRSTPYRFRTWLADPSQRGEVPGILKVLLDRELTIEFVDEPDGRVRLDMVSTFEGWAAVTRVLYTLQRGGVRMRGLEWLDLFDDVALDELDRLVRDWETRAHETAARRRMDALAGEATIRFAMDAQRRHPERKGWRSVAASAAHRTPGIDAFLLESAVAEPDPDVASLYGGVAAARLQMAELVSEPFDPPADLVVALARRRDRAAEAGYEIAIALPAPLDDELTEVLCAAVRRRGSGALGAVRALRKARPIPEVRAALEAALESTDADVRQLALESLGAVFGVGARSHWQEWLASSSAPQRMAAEDVIGAYGDADDVPLAAEHLGKIIRRKSSISWEPPRGNEIITLLVRHRELPEAQAALADLTKRWPKLPEELQAWLREHHPDLVPAEPTAARTASTLAEAPDAPEPPLTWPLPEIKRHGKEHYLGFWDTDMFDVRDRFEDLLSAHGSVTIVDGDREWTTARFDVPDPERLISELWSQAQADVASRDR